FNSEIKGTNQENKIINAYIGEEGGFCPIFFECVLYMCNGVYFFITIPVTIVFDRSVISVMAFAIMGFS
ncbi:MAG: hypothetical protein M3M88_01085, partial [Thermoproteota archaeon]|nr:hypothetical protein [Thermoproteota archaeon]